MADRIEIDVWQGDISALEVDAIVIAASESLFMTTGPAAAVKRRGGAEIERAAIDQAPVPPGSAIVTTGGMLPAPYVVHAVAVGHDRVADAGLLAQAVRSAVAFAEPLQLRRIAMALLGTETGAFTSDEAAATLVPALRAAAMGTPVESVVLAISHATNIAALREVVRATDTGAGVR